MNSFDKNLEQAEGLVQRYLDLQKQRQALEEKIASLKQEIADFSREARMKTLKSGNILLYVIQKLKTAFPRKDEPGRKEIEEIMRQSGEWRHAITFDIVRLGRAFDKHKLSRALMDKLTPFTRKEEVIRISTKDISKFPQK